MREKITSRLETLKAEREKGFTFLSSLQEQMQQANRALLNIDGAILICEELLKEEIPEE